LAHPQNNPHQPGRTAGRSSAWSWSRGPRSWIRSSAIAWMPGDGSP